MQPDPMFFDEVRQNLDAMEQSLLAISIDGGDLELINAIFRSAHSVKGGASAFGMTNLTELMHLSESLLDRWRHDGGVRDADGIGLLLEVVALARLHLADDVGLTRFAPDMLRRLKDMVQSDASRPGRRLVQVILDVSDQPGVENAVTGLFRDIAGLGEVLSESGEQGGRKVYSVRTDTPDAELLDLLAMHIDREYVSIRAAPVDWVTMPIAARPIESARSAASVRVSVLEIEQIGRIVDSLIDAGDRLASHANGLVSTGGADIRPALAQLQIDAAQLRQSLLAMRTAPISLAFDRIAGLLQGLSSKLGKQFKLVVKGEDLRLDRAMIQSLADLLTQLVRNSCDHGIESEAERLADGKSPIGAIGLEAAVKDGQVQIVVWDDGRGLSRARLLRAARAKGMDVSDDASDDAVWELIFVPGFSTTSAVTRLSGRGVGMDVVRRKAADFGGVVDVESSLGGGTRMTIRFPADGVDGATLCN